MPVQLVRSSKPRWVCRALLEWLLVLKWESVVEPEHRVLFNTIQAESHAATLSVIDALGHKSNAQPSRNIRLISELIVPVHQL